MRQKNREIENNRGKREKNAAKNSPEIVEHTASKSNGQHVLLKNQFLWA